MNIVRAREVASEVLRAYHATDPSGAHEAIAEVLVRLLSPSEIQPGPGPAIDRQSWENIRRGLILGRTLSAEEVFAVIRHVEGKPMTPQGATVCKCGTRWIPGILSPPERSPTKCPKCIARDER